MTLSVSDANILRKNWFSDEEVQDIANAVTPDGKPQPPVDLNSPLWRSVIRSRRSWYMGQIRRGKKKDTINSAIRNYYRKGAKRSIYDFLKAEYMPKKIVDFMTAYQRRAKNKTAKFGYKK